MDDLLLNNTGNNININDYGMGISNNNVDYVSQKLRITLSRFYGEFYLSADEGLPFYTTILEKNPNLQLISDLFKNEIMTVAEVKEITAFDLVFDRQLRKITITFSARLYTGEEVQITI